MPGDRGLNRRLADLGLDPGELPGVTVPIIFAALALETLFAGASTARSASWEGAIFQSWIVAFAAMIGLTAYAVGGLWDEKFFDPRYKPGGTWVRTEGRRWQGLLPGGADLDRDRLAAANVLADASPDGHGAYAAARDVVVEHKAWDAVTGPLAWSKAIRSLILPALLTSLGSLGVAASRFVQGEVRAGWGYLGLAAATAAFGVLAIAPYVQLKVDHMRRLYRLARRFAAAPTAAAPMKALT